MYHWGWPLLSSCSEHLDVELSVISLTPCLLACSDVPCKDDSGVSLWNCNQARIKCFHCMNCCGHGVSKGLAALQQSWHLSQEFQEKEWKQLCPTVISFLKKRKKRPWKEPQFSKECLQWHSTFTISPSTALWEVCACLCKLLFVLWKTFSNLGESGCELDA